MAGPLPGFDPQSIPISQIDHDLPPVTSDRLLEAALRARFLAPPQWTPEIVGDALRPDRPLRPAAVLIAVVLRDMPMVLLTRRTQHLSAHAGQISFPGGRVEPEDRDAAATALREAHEEVGLLPREVDVLGALPTYTTGTAFTITPIFGLVRPGYTLQIDPAEVDEAFEVPLQWLMNPANHRRHAVDTPGMRCEFLSMPWASSVAGEQDREYFIWGATASILRNLYRFLAA